MEAFAPTSCRHTRICVKTEQPTEFVDLTDQLKGLVLESGIQTGIVNVQSLHTTTAIMFVGSIQRGRIPGTGAIERVVFNEKLWELRRETILQDFHQRVRDVRQGPDGLIYLLTEEDDGAVIRIEPVN